MLGGTAASFLVLLSMDRGGHAVGLVARGGHREQGKSHTAEG